MKLRLDKLLVERGLVPSRERAQALILAGKVLVNEQKIEKSGASVERDVPLRLLGDDLKYVSRGGLKLERALDHWCIDVNDLVCLDVGAGSCWFSARLSAQPTVERVLALVEERLGRSLDATGLAGFGLALASGAPRANVAALVTNSAEAQHDMVLAFYQQSLHRTADVAGAAGFMSLLNQGASDGQVLAMIVGSKEYAGLAAT